MADQKISAMTPATLPLTGGELVPLVQGGNNVKTTTADITHINKNHASFSSSETQTTTANTATIVTLNTTDTSDGVTLVDGTKLKVPVAGTYNFQFSIQFTNAGAAIEDVSIWIAKNTNPVDNSCTDLSIPGKHSGTNGAAVAAWNFLLDLAANDFIQIYWSPTGTDISITAIGTRNTPTRPATPSVIVTVAQAY